jgi:hypothetical protein
MLIPGKLVEARWAVSPIAVRSVVLLLALCGTLFLAAGCTARQHQPAPDEEEETSIERPAVPLSEETSLSDRIGEVGVVLLVIGVAIGLILIPILLL